MTKFYVVCDYREKAIFNNQKNDHYSLKSINDIISGVSALGYDCSYFGGVKELIDAIITDNYDRNGIYLNFNDGLFFESKRGQTPILLELMGVKYSGSTPLTHLAVSDKYFTNNFLNDRIQNLFIPKSLIIEKEQDIWSIKLSFPIIVKPNNEGSSLGIDKNSLCKNEYDLKKQYYKIMKYGSVLAQEFVNGYELTAYFIRSSQKTILFNEILLISKNPDKAMNNDLFTYADKTNHNRTYYNPLEKLTLKDIDTIKNLTEQIADCLNILTLGRIDYKFYDNKIYFIEANTIPAFSATSDIGEICKIYGYSYHDILKLLVNALN